MNRILILPLISILLGCSPNPRIERIDQSKIAVVELNKKIQSLMDSANVTGLALTIFNDYKICYQQAFGYANMDEQIKLETKQVFYGASFSKAVFGYLVALLADEGIIDLDTPLQSYLDFPIPEMPIKKDWRDYKDLADDERYNTITARMCLSHTTGFQNWRWLTPTGLDEFGQLKINSNPGDRYSYSGEGIMLLHKVIEIITGKGLEEMAREKIFDPLEMDMTSYVWQDRFQENYCNGHTVDQQVIPKDTEDEAGAAGSMETTMEDYSKFITHILKSNKENAEVSKLLFEPSIQIHSKAQFGPDSFVESDDNAGIELSYGLGWGLLKSPYGYGAFKEGHSEGFQHYSIVFPERGTGIIIMSNSDNAESIFKELLKISIADVYTPWKWQNYIPYNHH